MLGTFLKHFGSLFAHFSKTMQSNNTHFSQMKVLTSPKKHLFYRGYEEIRKSMQITMSAIHSCFTVFFYSDDIHKTHQITNIQIPRNKQCFLACRALFLVFYSVKFVWCKICIFLVFCSHSRRHSRRQRPKMGANISLNVLIKR